VSAGAVERTWIKALVDEAHAIRLAPILQIRLETARLLVRRGVTDPDVAERYLNPQLKHLPDPFSMKGVDVAANRIADAIQANERITLYGDYDVDGVTSTSLLASFLKMHGVEARSYIPKRLIEGYGLNEEAVNTIAGWGTDLLITLDCGITASEEIQRANEHGIQTIVVDHHKCPPKLPPAFATLNPHQDDCPYPDKVLAAVGVTFNLIIAVRKVLRDRGVYGGDDLAEPNLKRMMDLVALGTIADMVPLTGVNRVLTWYGVIELKRAMRPGVRALMEVSKVRPVKVASSDVAFRLGPRINAAGRLHDASVGVKMLLTEDMSEARKYAQSLDHANGSRQQIEGDVFRAAVDIIDGWDALPHAIVLADESWHPGVVGIVCSKLVERYDRPAILVGEGGRGSARTAKGVHLYDAINDCSSFLTKFGGHRAAAGLRMSHKNVEAFRAALVDRVAQDPSYGEQTESTLIFDDDLSPEDIDYPFHRELSKLEPYGLGNPEPLFRMKNVRVRDARIVGGDHLKFRIMEGRWGGLSAIAFKRGDMHESMVPGRSLDLACHLDLNEWAGLEKLELRVRDLRPLDAPA
jgi:single-stranded-DNA-specific exonuclease